MQSKRNPILDLKKHKANSIHKRVQLICQAKCMILSRKSIYVHSVVKSAMLFNASDQPSSHADSIAILPRHPAMPSSHAILPCDNPTPSGIAVLHRRVASPTLRHSPMPTLRHSPMPSGIACHANSINIPLPMLYICFSTNYKPFAMLLPLCGLVLLFCCTFFKASFNCASIAPIAELYRSLLCHPSGHHSIAIRQGITASPSVRASQHH